MEILVLEASTTSAKAMLYHTDTGTFETAGKEYAVEPGGDITARDIEGCYRQMMAVGSELAHGRHIDLISLSGTWHSVALCDQKMEPVTPVYLWSYTGAAQVCREKRQDEQYVNDFYQRTGCMVNAIYPVFKLELLRRRGWKLSDYIVVSQGSYNTWRMTGERVSTRCLTSGTGLLNTHTRDYDDDILKEYGLSRAQLNTLVDAGAVYPLNQEGARLLGLQEGIPVIPTNSDGGLNQVGVGALEEGVATFSVGTSGALRLSSAVPVLPEKPSTWCYLSPKGWLTGAATNGCCNCVDWAKAKLFPPGTGYGEIEAGISDRVTTPVFLPFLFGERCPGWDDDRKGGFVNILPQHNANDLYRAVQEGVLFNLYHCYRILGSVAAPPKEIKISGGILNSLQWSQMCADIFNTTLTIDNVVQGSMLGGAVLGMEQLGIIADAKDYKPQVSGTIVPNPENVPLYQEKFERYLKAYRASGGKV